jgi:hypothetical protein
MRTGLSEALDILGKFLTESTILECSINTAVFMARFRGRVVRVLSDELRLLSDDTESELALALPSFVEFEYGELRGPDAPEGFEGALIFVLRRGEPGKESDFISLTEIVP